MDMTPQYPNAVHLTVSDVKKSIKFYSEKLGFTLKECYPDAKKPMWASMVLDKQVVMFGAQMTPDGAKEMGATKDEIALTKRDLKAFNKGPLGVGVAIYVCVADVDAHYKFARKKRAEMVTAPKTQFYGIRDYTVQDPDGYRMVMYTPTVQGCSDTPTDAACTTEPNQAIEA